MPTHVTKVSCHSISGLRQSYNYMCSRTYYLIIRTLSLLRSVEAARYGKIFPLPYRHVWTLSYTYRILISPIDKSSKQRKNKTKQKHNISMLCTVASPRRTRDWPFFYFRLLRCCKGSLRHGEGPPILPKFFIIPSLFSEIKPKLLNTPKASLRITPKWVLTQAKPNIEKN